MEVTKKMCTPAKTNMEPENIPWKRGNTYKPPIVGFHVNFQGCVQVYLRRPQVVMSNSFFETHFEDSDFMEFESSVKKCFLPSRKSMNSTEKYARFVPNLEKIRTQTE